MVHFNLRLRANTFAEWRADYLDYKQLKKALRKQKNIDLQLERAAAAATAGFDTGSDALPFSTRSAYGSTVELQSLLTAPVAFEVLLDDQYDKVERAYMRHLAHFSGQLRLLREQYRADAPPAAQESVKNSLVEMHRMLHHLHNFALLNYTGFVKIIKKHDKMFPTSPALAREHNAKMQQFEFANATECRGLLHDVEQLFAKLYCNGDIAVAVATLMTKKEEAMNWAQVYMGIKLGSCLILMVWVIWDAVIVPSFKSEREKHIIDLTATRAFPVYRGIGCVLLLHWLIGVSMFVWRRARINYRYIFELDPRTTPSYTQVFNDAMNMTLFYLVNVLMYYKVVNGYFPEKILFRGYYPLMLFVVTIYFYLIHPWPRQRGLFVSLGQIACAPFFAVSFFDVFVGDYLTSTVKVTQDLAWSVCFFGTREFMKKDHIHETVSEWNATVSLLSAFRSAQTPSEPSCLTNPIFVFIIVPLICALPLWWRFLQSLRRIYDAERWFPNLPNAGKYALTQVVALFGIFHPFYTRSADPTVGWQTYQVVWIVLFTLSSTSTWFWDVRMDWGLGLPNNKFLGDRHMFSSPWVYYIAVVADLFMRFAWTLTLIPPGTSRSLPLFLQPFMMVVELFRRTFWGFFRLENEHLRNTERFRRVDFIPLHYDHGVGEEETESNNELEPLDGTVFIIKILLIFCLVIALSVLAILVEQD